MPFPLLVDASPGTSLSVSSQIEIRQLVLYIIHSFINMYMYMKESNERES